MKNAVRLKYIKYLIIIVPFLFSQIGLLIGAQEVRTSSPDRRVEIPFIISNTGHLLIDALLNKNHKVKLILDTAAGANVIDAKAAKNLNLKTKDNKGLTGAGLGVSEQKMSFISVDQIQLGDAVYLNPEFMSIDLHHVMAAGGGSEIHGLLGAPFFKKYQAIIDYEKNMLSIKTQK